MEASDISLEDRLSGAQYELQTATDSILTSIKLIGMTRSYGSQDPNSDLFFAIERFAKAMARHEMLHILSTEDFFVAMSRSAGYASDT